MWFVVKRTSNFNFVWNKNFAGDKGEKGEKGGLGDRGIEGKILK